MTPGQVVHRNKLIELIQYTPTTDKVQSVPLLFIPPWINKYYILDMQPQNSLIKFLVDQGFTVFVISWKNPDASMEDTTFDDYLEMGPLTALGVVKEITGSPTVTPVGYCIGGTLLSMTLPYLAAQGDTSVKAATFLVALQDFTEVGDTAVLKTKSSRVARFTPLTRTTPGWSFTMRRAAMVALPAGRSVKITFAPVRASSSRMALSMSSGVIPIIESTTSSLARPQICPTADTNPPANSPCPTTIARGCSGPPPALSFMIFL